MEFADNSDGIVFIQKILASTILMFIIYVNLTLSANHPVHPCAPTKSSAHAYTQNCAHTRTTA